jgi:predicted alpha-1,2-mannosidase
MVVCLMIGSIWALRPERGECADDSVQAGELGRHVNPFVGTGGLYYLCGNEFPGATMPFGMVRLSPDTVANNGRKAYNTSGYYYRDQKLLGFSHTRLAGTGATDGGNFLIVPSDGSLGWDQIRRGLNTPFRHQDETAFPGYYSVKIPAFHLKAELTATERVGVHRYTFDGGDTAPYFIFHVSSALGRGRSTDGEVRVFRDTNDIDGHVRSYGTFSSRYGGINVYFVARFNRPFTGFQAWKGGKRSPSQSVAKGDDIAVELLFDRSTRPNTIEIKVGLSYVSIENARANLDSEAGSLTFDQVLAKARDAWEQKLSLIRVEGGTPKQTNIFYTALYHSLQMPTVFNDVNGDYIGFDGRVHQASKFRYYTDMSLWDTFRTAHPLFMLIAPREQRDMVVSLVEMARQGGYLPRWPSGNGYTNSMFGTPADMVVAETYAKGIRDFDAETAYQAMRKTALGPTTNSRFSGRAGIEDYVKYGYCPSDRMKQSVARTLEFCYADDAVARLAKALGHQDDAAIFEKHARSYRKIWNPETQYFHPRDSRGKFDAEFRPLLLTYLDAGGKYTSAYVEGNALQWRWAVPHDPKGLISLFKSKETFVKELDQFFAQSSPTVGTPPNPYYWHGNQPDIYAAYLFNAADRPDLTQKWVRWILDVKYGDGENGLDGNDDGGTLSAWYVLSSLGIFPTAGSDRYELASPLWKRAEIKLGDRRLVVIAENFAPENLYVQKVWLNDKLLDGRQLKHADIVGGGTLRFEMGPKPAGR